LPTAAVEEERLAEQ